MVYAIRIFKQASKPDVVNSKTVCFYFYIKNQGKHVSVEADKVLLFLLGRSICPTTTGTKRFEKLNG